MITSNKKQAITIEDILKNNPNTKIIFLDPEKEYEEIKNHFEKGKVLTLVEYTTKI